MRRMNMKNATSKTQLLLPLVVAVVLSLAQAAFAAAPGITSTAGTAGTFNLTAQDAYLNQPDGNAVYSWGYGCVAPAAGGTGPTFVPAAISGAYCNTMQVPGPTMVVTEGTTVIINLTNNLPPAAGNTSILFPGFNVTTTCTGAGQQQGLLTCEAAPGSTVSYTFTASEAGTHAYYSGTQGDLQVEMGLYGAIIVLPSSVPTNCANNTAKTNLYGLPDYGSTHSIPGFPESDFRLAKSAYDHPKTCYDREYLFQWAEMDPRIHTQAAAQVQAKAGCTAGAPGCNLTVQTEPYHPAYFLINGRSMPDLMDPNYASEYPHQPYNGNPHMHPGELTLIRTIGQGRWQHPFHEHANHVRILARDGNLQLSPTNPTQSLAGLLMFNTDTTPGESFDGIFYFSGRGLNWDPYGHHPPGAGTTLAPLTITKLSEAGTTVTATVVGSLPPAAASAPMVVAGVTNTGYDGTFTVTSLNPGLAFTITSITEATTKVTATVTGVLPAALVGTPVTIAGVPKAGYNGTFTVTGLTAGATTSTISYTAASGLGTSGTLTAATTAVTDLTTLTYTVSSTGLATEGLGGTATVNLGATSSSPFPTDANATLPCFADANGYNTGVDASTGIDHTATVVGAINYYEWCQDHNKPVEVAPFGDVASGGPVTLPDPNVFTNGAWYGGSQYLGPDAALRSRMAGCDTTTNANCTTLMPSNVQANPSNERGWAFMWHSHNEREITTNNVFPGGMLMMMLVDSREFPIDETQ
jgi:FtsP/CotA-like multicopper oxidase with cupredoxin domain